MNSYKMLSNNHGFYGMEINDGMINETDDEFYNLQEIIETFVSEFPNAKAYTLFRDNEDIILRKLSGEELQFILDTLDKQLGLDIYIIKQKDFDLLIQQVMHIYKTLFETVSELMSYESEEKGLEAFKQVLITLGFNIITMDDDIIKKIYHNVKQWVVS
jgi:hypothetical protein